MIRDTELLSTLVVYQERRSILIQRIQKQYDNSAERGKIVLFGGFESDRQRFRQESSFFYFSGIVDPGAVLVIDIATEHTTLYIPQYGTNRALWMDNPLVADQASARRVGVDQIKVLGHGSAGYQFHPFFQKHEYEYFIEYIVSTIEDGAQFFTLYPHNVYEYVQQRSIIERLKNMIPTLSDVIVDISAIVAAMRRTKSMYEIEKIAKAIEITTIAQESAAQAIAHEMTESEVQASLEYMMIAAQAIPSFPSIVASGKNATILHYGTNKGTMKDGNLVVVDIGAEFEYYCADITRTYPVSGTFTKRQKEIYQIVLDTQEYIAAIAKPGYWLNNKEHPEKSLHHLAKEYLRKFGYDHYFIHGIGHYLGIDVHDVGNYTEPLKAGDVFTIEPGIYIPEEAIGVRIEDNYWMVEDELVCLSEGLPKKIVEIEALMKEQARNDDASFDIDLIDFEQGIQN